jgi:hypothetical protein
MLMSSNDYQKLCRYQPRKGATKKSTINKDLLSVIPDIPRHNFMQTMVLKQSKSAMHIIDHEEEAKKLPVLNHESTDSLVLMDSVKQGNQENLPLMSS